MSQTVSQTTSMMRRIARRVVPRRQANGGHDKSWEGSQQYELNHALHFMEAESYRQLHANLLAGRMKMSAGYFNELLLKEFFAGSREELAAFVEHVRGRKCLDVGPCALSPVSTWDLASTRFAIEPLFPGIDAWQRGHLGGSAYEGMTVFAQPAEALLSDLVGAIDGAILCRNMLDHTPKWPFVLSNIASYAAPGCRLLLWTDLDHQGTADEGHYDIGVAADAFRRLVTQFGWDILREYEDTARHEKNWGCFAIRRSPPA